jgi:hypothetical protein
VAIEIGDACVLALVAIATAWSGYQSAFWDGRSTKLYGDSSRIRIQAKLTNNPKLARVGREPCVEGRPVLGAEALLVAAKGAELNAEASDVFQQGVEARRPARSTCARPCCWRRSCS